MTVARLQHCAHWILLGALLASCSTDPEENPHHGIDGCKGEPYRGYCIDKRGSGGSDQDAASDEVGMLGDAGPGGKDAGGDSGAGDGGLRDLDDASFDESGMLLPPHDVKEGAECEGMIFEPCYLGPDDTEGNGACKGGMRLCECESGEEECEQRVWGKCIGQVLPSIETCNNVDDDCNVAIDDGITLGSCVVTGAVGACEVGEERCAEGMGVVTCEPVKGATSEVCNGINDDCDDEIDEDTNVACYGDGMPGCTMNGEGGFDCFGLCKPGMKKCVERELGDCEGAVPPTDELCTDPDPQAVAANEDCDELTDEDCECDDGDSHPCYGGPVGTEGVGECHAGLQTCSNNRFGDCEGEQRDEPETCSNISENNDCDTATDEDQGANCTVGSNRGRCVNGTLGCVGSRLGCVTLEPLDEDCNSQDDDCDGRIDEDFDLDTNPDNCGVCGRDCDPGFDCCAGNCVNLQIDRNHCGSCPNQCGAGLSCCSGGCVNLQNDGNNCGICGRNCLLGCCQGACCLL